MTTREDVERWIKLGKEQGSKALIVVCDTFDWMDYPVYVSKEENIEDVKSKYKGVNMQKIMEVIEL